jgi:hypothetical protein
VYKNSVWPALSSFEITLISSIVGGQREMLAAARRGGYHSRPPQSWIAESATPVGILGTCKAASYPDMGFGVFHCLISARISSFSFRVIFSGFDGIGIVN